MQIEVQEVVRSIKRRAEQHPNAPPSAIFREEVSEVRNEEFIMTLPERNDIIRNLNRIQNRNRPPNVNLLQNLVIQPSYDETSFINSILVLMKRVTDHYCSIPKKIWNGCAVVKLSCVMALSGLCQQCFSNCTAFMGS